MRRVRPFIFGRPRLLARNAADAHRTTNRLTYTLICDEPGCFPDLLQVADRDVVRGGDTVRCQ